MIKRQNFIVEVYPPYIVPPLSLNTEISEENYCINPIKHPRSHVTKLTPDIPFLGNEHTQTMKWKGSPSSWPQVKQVCNYDNSTMRDKLVIFFDMLVWFFIRGNNK